MKEEAEMDKFAEAMTMVQKQKADERFAQHREEDRQRREEENVKAHQSGRDQNSTARGTAEDRRTFCPTTTRNKASASGKAKTSRRAETSGQRRPTEDDAKDHRRTSGTESIRRRASFLNSFEQTMKLQDTGDEDWNLHLVGVLGGQIRDACKEVDLSVTPYPAIKETILRYFSVNPETQKAKFRELKWDRKGNLERYVQQMRILEDG